MQGVTIRQPLKGRVDVLPRMVLAAKGDSSFAVASADASKIINFLIVPVIEVNKKMKSSQEVRDGWDRVLKEVDFSETPNGAKPLIVSARKNWKLYQDQINIIEAAYVLDGAKYLEYLQRSKEIQAIPIIVLFDKKEEEELSIRNKISESGTFSIHDITRILREKTKNGQLEIPEVEVQGASLFDQANIRFRDFPGVLMLSVKVPLLHQCP
jgi:hypothetical protein